MKKLLYLLPITIAFIYACGGGAESTGEATEETGDAETTAVVAKGTAVDLSDYGMPYSMVIPDPSSAQIAENDWGGVEIVNGDAFMVLLAFGEGNMEMLKADLNSGIYTSTILDEGPNYLVYKREIPDAGVEPEVHFVYVASIGEDIIEISNLKEVVYSEESIQKMLAAAKTFAAPGA